MLLFVIVFLFILFLIIIAASKVKSNKQIAALCNLPTETINTENKILGYYSLYKNTQIDKIAWGIDNPIYKVQEYNCFNDYWAVNKEQSVIADLYACVGSPEGAIYIDDKYKIPDTYHSDKLSEVSLYNDYSGKTVYVDLSEKEVLDLERLVFGEDFERLDTTDFYLDSNNLWEKWKIRFHIEGLEGLYYSGGDLVKAKNGDYYIASGYAYAYAEVPKETGEKIDRAFNKANIDF